MRRTATTSNAILGLLALRPRWSTWELATQLGRNMRFFWPRAESRIYDEARALDQKGLARATRTMHGRRQRTTYAITARGRRQLRTWMATPPRATTLECEPILRVLLADLGTADELLTAIAQVRADGEAVLAVGRVVGAEYLAGTAPFQDDVHARALVLDFLSHHAIALIEWADRAEQAVAGWTDATDSERAAAAVETVRRCLAAYPAPPRAEATGP
ncbi:MAG TPA: PadR family transcriptional regulator [Gaiellales bacterium]